MMHLLGANPSIVSRSPIIDPDYLDQLNYQVWAQLNFFSFQAYTYSDVEKWWYEWSVNFSYVLLNRWEGIVERDFTGIRNSLNNFDAVLWQYIMFQ